MAFTAQQLQDTETAIAQLAAGAQEVEDAYGNRVRKPDLAGLIKLKKIMEEDVRKAGRTSGFDKVKFVAKT